MSLLKSSEHLAVGTALAHTTSPSFLNVGSGCGLGRYRGCFTVEIPCPLAPRLWQAVCFSLKWKDVSETHPGADLRPVSVPGARGGAGSRRPLPTTAETRPVCTHVLCHPEELQLDVCCIFLLHIFYVCDIFLFFPVHFQSRSCLFSRLCSLPLIYYLLKQMHPPRALCDFASTVRLTALVFDVTSCSVSSHFPHLRVLSVCLLSF